MQPRPPCPLKSLECILPAAVGSVGRVLLGSSFFPQNCLEVVDCMSSFKICEAVSSPQQPFVACHPISLPCPSCLSPLLSNKAEMQKQDNNSLSASFIFPLTSFNYVLSYAPLNPNRKCLPSLTPEPSVMQISLPTWWWTLPWL